MKDTCIWIEDNIHSVFESYLPMIFNILIYLIEYRFSNM